MSSQPQEIQLFDRFSRPMWRGQEPLIIDNKEFMSLLDNRKGWFDSVSYTHLDVYKRQYQNLFL